MQPCEARTSMQAEPATDHECNTQPTKPSTSAQQQQQRPRELKTVVEGARSGGDRWRPWWWHRQRPGNGNDDRSSSCSEHFRRATTSGAPSATAMGLHQEQVSKRLDFLQGRMKASPAHSGRAYWPPWNSARKLTSTQTRIETRCTRPTNSPAYLPRV